MLDAVTGRLYLYGTLVFNMAAWAAQQALDRVLSRRHPLNWPADQVCRVPLPAPLPQRPHRGVHW